MAKTTKKAPVKREGPRITKAAEEQADASLDVIVRQAQQRARAEKIATLRARGAEVRAKLAMMGAMFREQSMLMPPELRAPALEAVKLYDDAVAVLRDYDGLVS